MFWATALEKSNAQIVQRHPSCCPVAIWLGKTTPSQLLSKVIILYPSVVILSYYTDDSFLWRQGIWRNREALLYFFFLSLTHPTVTCVKVNMGHWRAIVHWTVPKFRSFSYSCNDADDNCTYNNFHSRDLKILWARVWYCDSRCLKHATQLAPLTSVGMFVELGYCSV